MPGLKRSLGTIVRRGRVPSKSFEFASCALDPARQPYRARKRGANPFADLRRQVEWGGTAMSDS